MKKISKLLLIFIVILTTLFGCGSKEPTGPTGPTDPTDPVGTKTAEDFMPLLDYAFDYIDYRILFTSKEALGRLVTYGPDVVTHYWAGMVDQVNGAYRNSLTAEEFAELEELVDFWGMDFEFAYNKDEINSVFEKVYGAKKIDVHRWTHGFVMGGITESSQYIIVDIPQQSRQTFRNQLYKITDVKEVDGLYYISMKVLLCEPDYGALDGSKFRDHTYESGWLKNKVYTGSSFDDAVTYYGVDESKLGTMTFAIKDTESGFRIDGLIEESEHVLPDTFGYFFHGNVTGTGKGGLRLRQGPATSYEIITVIPEGAEVVEIGYNFGNTDWLFVTYKEHSGWVAAEFLEFQGGYAKPVIYLYPEKTIDVDVKLVFHDNAALTVTYPQYNNGWKVLAHPDGKLINYADNREYSYLYWEGIGDTKYDLSKGFVVKKEETIDFLQEKLAYLGLTPKEYNEFIVFWLPYLQESDYNLITFQTTCYTEAVELQINPKPDSMLRVYMVYKPLEKPISIPEQKLEPFTRKGFTVVEWGGAMLDW